jgi:hypothetical protein
MERQRESEACGRHGEPTPSLGVSPSRATTVQPPRGSPNPVLLGFIEAYLCGRD